MMRRLGLIAALDVTLASVGWRLLSTPGPGVVGEAFAALLLLALAAGGLLLVLQALAVLVVLRPGRRVSRLIGRLAAAPLPLPVAAAMGLAGIAGPVLSAAPAAADLVAAHPAPAPTLQRARPPASLPAPTLQRAQPPASLPAPTLQRARPPAPVPPPTIQRVRPPGTQRAPGPAGAGGARSPAPRTAPAAAAGSGATDPGSTLRTRPTAAEPGRPRPPLRREVRPAGSDRARASAGPTGPAPRIGRPWSVRQGDSFWSIARAVLAGARGEPPTAHELARYWVRLVDANADRLPVPGDPDVLFVGDVVVVPALPRT